MALCIRQLRGASCHWLRMSADHVKPPGDRAMRMRFWSGITRGLEKWVKLVLGHFLG